MEHTAEVHWGAQGRLVIPSNLRREMNLVRGDRLLIRTQDNRLILEKPEQTIQGLRKRFEPLPADMSLADELISERRIEAKGE